MKKFIKVICSICFCLIVPLVVAGCGINSGCKGTGEWKYNSQYHWQQCQDIDCPTKVDYGKHSFDLSGICKCGYRAFEGASYTYLGDGKYELTSYDSSLEQTTICVNDAYNDGTHGEGQVTQIGEEAFRYNNYIETVTLPDSILVIDSNAFFHCSNLSQINFGNQLKTIASGAFSGTNLQNVTIPDSVTTIGDKAFSSCYNLQTVKLPNSLTKISDELFRDCENLTSVEAPSSITKIGESAFSRCGKLVSFPLSSLTNLQTISASSFDGCEKLENITIPSSVTTIKERAFAGCRKLTTITIPNKVTALGESAFGGCTDLKTVNFFNSLTNIGNKAFDGSVEKVCYYGTLESWTQIDGLSGLLCGTNDSYHGVELYINNNKLSEINLISSNISKIKPYAFYHIDNIQNIRLPSSLENIGTNAFTKSAVDVQKSANVYFAGDINAWVTMSGHENLMYKYDNVNLYVNSNQAVTNITITATKIDDYAFARCKNISNVSLPSSLESIGDYSFWGSTVNYKEVGNAKYLGNSSNNLVLVSFNDSTATTFEIDPNCKFILGRAFDSSKLTKINISENVIYIGKRAFGTCESLTSAIIKGNVTIAENAFDGCTSLSTLVIMKAKSIGKGAFKDCNLTRIFVGYDSWWDDFDMSDSGLEGLTKYYYSEQEKTYNNYWHFDDSGNPQVWTN